jgi:protein required for attachment to host cells
MTNTHFTMPKVQILVANSGQARFFSVDSPTGELHELGVDINPDARMRGEDLTSDRPGRFWDRSVHGRSAAEEPTDPKDVSIQRFARQLAHKLDLERTQGRLERLYLVASPPFLGELRKHLNGHLKPLIVEEIAKDFGHMAARDLRKHLPERLK